MKKFTFSTLIIAAAMGFMAVSTTHAADVKFPEKTDPAFTFSLPADWKADPDGSGNLIVKSPDRSAALSLSMIDDADTAKMTSEAVAKAIFAAAGVIDGNKQEAATVGDKKGTAYFGTIKGGDDTMVNVKLIVLKLDDKHVASLTVITNPTISPEGQAVVNKLVDSFKITAAK